MTDFTAALHFLRLNRFQRRQRRLQVQIKPNYYQRENIYGFKESLFCAENVVQVCMSEVYVYKYTHSTPESCVNYHQFVTLLLDFDIDF